MAAVESTPTGLRERQKSRRRREILDAAKDLFETDGYEETTVAKIAEMAEVSAPTVFNYFGSKDELIVALVLEIHEDGRVFMQSWRPEPGVGVGELLGDMLCIYAELTMKLAGKRIWRYAEATNIRNPDSPVVRMFTEIEAYHVDEIGKFLCAAIGADTPETRRNCTFLASVAYRCWNARFHDYIRDSDMSLETHKQRVRAEMRKLGDLVSLTPGT